MPASAAEVHKNIDQECCNFVSFRRLPRLFEASSFSLGNVTLLPTSHDPNSLEDQVFPRCKKMPVYNGLAISHIHSNSNFTFNLELGM